MLETQYVSHCKFSVSSSLFLPSCVFLVHVCLCACVCAHVRVCVCVFSGPVTMSAEYCSVGNMPLTWFEEEKSGLGLNVASGRTHSFKFPKSGWRIKGNSAHEIKCHSLILLHRNHLSD